MELINKNQVPEGYKKTEIGVIPEDWEVKQIHQIIEVDPENLTSKTDPDYEFKYISLEDVDNGCLCNYSNQIFSQAPSRARRILRYQDILFATVRPNLKSHLFFDKNESDWICSTGFAVLRCKENQSASGFIFAYLFSRAITAQIEALISGSNYPAINSNDVKNLEILLPPLPEQKAIAQTLSDVDALIAALDKLIAKKRNIKTATMQQLLTGKTRLLGFDGEWETKMLGELGIFSKGAGIKKDDVLDYGLPCIRYGEIYTRHHDLIKIFYSFISQNVASNSHLIKSGDLLFTGSGETSEEIGKCVAFIGDESAYAGGDIVIFSPKEQDSMFLGYLMNHESIIRQKSRMGQGDAVVHIQAKNLAQLQLYLPPVEEQKAIAQVLSDIDTEITALEKRRAKTQAIKQGMMQELLTGRTRLKFEPPDDDPITKNSNG